MDQKNAIKLLDDTFNQDYNLDRFAQFIKELFNHFNLRIKKDIPLRKEYYDYVDTMDSLGVYRDNNRDSIEVFAVKLKKASSRDRARTMQRNLVAKYLKNSGSNAALVAFYGEDPQDWRFSFVKLEYDLIKDEKGNLKVKEDITPAKRYSFLVGKHEPNHTCRSQFLSLIKEENTDPLLEIVEEAFSIESVTKEFFEEYKKLFLKLQESLEQVIDKDEVIKNEFDKKSIPTADFAKKLMGQIVFIYFLQKKGWLGVEKGEKWGEGPRNFLRKLFNKEMIDYENFFNDILEPLFYEAFATPRDEDYYRHFDCKIPFLNGGLFEPINDYDWVQTEITLKNKIFNDILDVFDLYNFTIKEDEPLDKEVAVDPEMLGKVFEKLLKVKDRKSRGAFYTPREIVHHMCQESLINYLETNSDISREDIENFIHLGDFYLDNIIREIIEFGKLKKDRDHGLPKSIRENYRILNDLLIKIKVVDPAVGSGAFPVGMMNEIVKARSIFSFLSGELKSNYQLKLETIRDCLYGVDVDSSAVDITKLRFWLSLIVDEEDIQKIDPLPNIDHKIMCGNSLLEEFEGKKLFNEDLLDELIIDNSKELEEIKKKREELYVELGMIHTGKIKDKNLKDVEKEIKKLDNKEKKLQSLVQDVGQQFTLDDDYKTRRIKESQRKLRQLNELHEKFFKEQNTKKKKKYREEFESIEWEFIEETLREDGNENSIEKIEEYKKNKSKPFFLWKLYFAEVFQRENPGFDIIIANPPYAVSFNDDEKKVLEEKYPSVPDYESSNYFMLKSYDLLREGGVKSFITINTFLMNIFAKKFRLELLKKWNFIFINNLSEFDVFESAKVRNCITLFKKEKKKNFLVTFANFKENSGINVINEVDKKYLKQNIDNWLTIFTQDNKIISILNKIKKETKELNSFADVSQGLIPYDKYRGHSPETIKNRIWHADYRKDETYKEELKGRDVDKYYLKWNGKTWISYGDWLAAPRKKEFFTNKRIILREITNPSILATYTEEEYYNTPSIINIINFDEINPLFLLGVINSKLISFYHFETSPKAKKGLFPKILVNDVRKLPIKPVTQAKQKDIIELVTKILNITKDTDFLKDQTKKIKFEELVDKIDEEVYKLYELSSKEIEIINNFQFIREN